MFGDTAVTPVLPVQGSQTRLVLSVQDPQPRLCAGKQAGSRQGPWNCETPGFPCEGSVSRRDLGAVTRAASTV